MSDFLHRPMWNKDNFSLLFLFHIRRCKKSESSIILNINHRQNPLASRLENVANIAMSNLQTGFQQVRNFIIEPHSQNKTLYELFYEFIRRFTLFWLWGIEPENPRYMLHRAAMNILLSRKLGSCPRDSSRFSLTLHNAVWCESLITTCQRLLTPRKM
jgi:hypothetical protein